jgi:mRNA interferase RelE/StbE
MTYKIAFNRAYIKDLKRIPVDAQKQIREKIATLAVNPRPEGCKKLRGSFYPPLFRIRCGDYRIVYSVDDGVLLILVIDVDHRSEIYKNIV